ncbi:MAG: hypothetical protein AB8G23_11700 [Myxococcota bacterium]
MAKVATAFLLVVGLWISGEVYEKGPTNAFGGLFKSFASDQARAEPKIATAQRAGEAVSRAQDEANARRERMLGE